MEVTGIFRGLISAAMILSACSGKDDPNASGTATSTTETSSSKGGTSSSGDASDSESTTTTGTTGTSSTGTSTSTSTDPTDPTDPCLFLGCDDFGGGSEDECDLWSQDCPEGDKCTPWDSDGGSSWNASKCVPVDPAPQLPGDACTTEGGPASGVDNCAKGSMCWDVDAETGEGVCIALCEGTNAEDATCDPGFTCKIPADGVLILCLPVCDPLSQDCPAGDLCLPYVDAFICVADASGEGGFYGDPCEYANACKLGLYCLNPEYVEGCQAAGCCTPFCDINEANTCPGETQECIPWYEEWDMPPPGLASVGFCGVPQ